ncbi:tail protein X [Azonexus hydrophilus]|uniref:Tail protein X n=1 Tax=Azonexus hydrophilus TaxID=418702 RepID=A0ABZ2XCF5_9RHOO
MQVRSHQGDSVDSLCWRHLGSSAPVESVLEANPGLAALGPILPEGTLVTLPDSAPATSIRATINLWD